MCVLTHSNTRALTFENLLQKVRDITRLVVTYREQVFFFWGGGVGGGGGEEISVYGCVDRCLCAWICILGFSSCVSVDACVHGYVSWGLGLWFSSLCVDRCLCVDGCGYLVFVCMAMVRV